MQRLEKIASEIVNWKTQQVAQFCGIARSIFLFGDPANGAQTIMIAIAHDENVLNTILEFGHCLIF